MSIGAVANLGSYLQSVLATALHKTSSTANSSGNNVSVGSSSLQLQPDNGQLSPFAELMSTLQQLQQSNPTQYQQVTQQIATNLQSAAQTATADGNTSAASQLTTLSNDFSSASQNGQLPNIQDLAQAVSGGGHHHHHHHVQAAPSASTTSSTSTSTDSSTSDTSNANNPLSQLLAAFQASATQNEAFNPTSIINSTLSSAGISLSS